MFSFLSIDVAFGKLWAVKIAISANQETAFRNILADDNFKIYYN
jgi:hypothetical protein